MRSRNSKVDYSVLCRDKASCKDPSFQGAARPLNTTEDSPLPRTISEAPPPHDQSHHSKSKRKNAYAKRGDNLPTTLEIFCDIISIRGMGKIRRAPTSFLRLLWLSFVTGMTVVLLVTSGFLVAGYLNYDTAWHTSTLIDHATEFPAITLCSHNPFSLTASELWSQDQVMSPKEFKVRLMNSISRAVRRGERQMSSFSLLDNVDTYYANLDLNQSVRLSHSRNMLYFCMVTTRSQGIIIATNCSVEEMTNLKISLFSHSEYFNCWTVDGREGLTTSDVLSITFLVKLIPTRKIPQMKNAFIMDLLKRGEGLKVVVHERGTYPDIMGNAINIQPGKMNQILYEPTKWIRYSSPIKPCKSDQPNLRDLDREFSYTFPQCLESEVQKEYLNKCNCMLTTKPHREVQPQGRPYCAHGFSQPDKTQNLSQCVMEMLEREKEIKAKAQYSICFPRCSYFTFITELSVSNWIASNTKLNRLVKIYGSVDIVASDNNITDEEMENHLQILNDLHVENDPKSNNNNKKEEDGDILSEESFTYVSLTRKHDDATIQREKLTLDVYILMSRIGGLCSLFMGLSVSFVIEMVEFIYLSCHAGKQRRLMSHSTAHESANHTKAEDNIAGVGTTTIVSVNPDAVKMAEENNEEYQFTKYPDDALQLHDLPWIDHHRDEAEPLCDAHFKPTTSVLELFALPDAGGEHIPISTV